MYLVGKKYLWTDWEHSENNLQEDGFRLKEKTLDLGYWRKHPNLHGFIVQTFANGKDRCQEIELDADNLRAIIEAVESSALPTTTGFFFGASAGNQEEIEEDVGILNKAIEWLETKEEGAMRSAYYQASW